MSESRVVKKTRNLAESVCNEVGVRLWDILFKKEGTNWYLRIFIDKPGGADINDCEKVSRLIDPLLDEEDFIEQSYFLEVSSAGLDRQLRTKEHFISCIGMMVNVKFYRPINGEKEILGVELLSFSDETIGVSRDGVMLELAKEDVADVRLHDEY